jgi:hypothetical protein
VAFPPGRLKLATKPDLTGSAAKVETIGTEDVAALACSNEGVVVNMTATPRRTRSAANSGNRSNWFSAQRYSIRTFWPSLKPPCLRPCANAVRSDSARSGDVWWRNPITGIAGCCARAASGHAAAPPSSVMNWRRLKSSMGSSPEPAVPA